MTDDIHSDSPPANVVRRGGIFWFEVATDEQHLASRICRQWRHDQLATRIASPALKGRSTAVVITQRFQADTARTVAALGNVPDARCNVELGTTEFHSGLVAGKIVSADPRRGYQGIPERGLRKPRGSSTLVGSFQLAQRRLRGHPRTLFSGGTQERAHRRIEA